MIDHMSQLVVGEDWGQSGQVLEGQDSEKWDDHLVEEAHILEVAHMIGLASTPSPALEPQPAGLGQRGVIGYWPNAKVVASVPPGSWPMGQEGKNHDADRVQWTCWQDEWDQNKNGGMLP